MTTFPFATLLRLANQVYLRVARPLVAPWHPAGALLSLIDRHLPPHGHDSSGNVARADQCLYYLKESQPLGDIPGESTHDLDRAPFGAL